MQIQLWTGAFSKQRCHSHVSPSGSVWPKPTEKSVHFSLDCGPEPLYTCPLLLQSVLPGNHVILRSDSEFWCDLLKFHLLPFWQQDHNYWDISDMCCLIKSKINTNCWCTIKKQRQYLTVGQVKAKTIKISPGLVMGLMRLKPWRLFLWTVQVSNEGEPDIPNGRSLQGSCLCGTAHQTHARLLHSTAGWTPMARMTWNKACHPTAATDTQSISTRFTLWALLLLSSISTAGWARDESYKHRFMTLFGPVGSSQVLLYPCDIFHANIKRAQPGMKKKKNPSSSNSLHLGLALCFVFFFLKLFLVFQ